MTSLHKHHKRKKIRWSMIAGILLLIISLATMAVSHTKADDQKDTARAVSEETDTTDTALQYTAEDFTDMDDSSWNDFSWKSLIVEYTQKASSDTASEEITSKKKSKKAYEKEVESQINYDCDYPYMIMINKAENFAVVYGMDDEGRHTIPYKAFICSTGLDDDDTPEGVFEISDKYRWRLMVDGTYAQYAVRINGQIMLHSVPYEEPSSDTLEYWEYNKLGDGASLGCVRFRVSAIKWIYDNCDAGTKVCIYSEPDEKPPLKISSIKKIKASDSRSGWDPTDPDEDNPWKSSKKKSKKNSTSDESEETTETAESEETDKSEEMAKSEESTESTE